MYFSRAHVIQTDWQTILWSIIRRSKSTYMFRTHCFCAVICQQIRDSTACYRKFERASVVSVHSMLGYKCIGYVILNQRSDKQKCSRSMMLAPKKRYTNINDTRKWLIFRHLSVLMHYLHEYVLWLCSNSNVCFTLCCAKWSTIQSFWIHFALACAAICYLEPTEKRCWRNRVQRQRVQNFKENGGKLYYLILNPACTYFTHRLSWIQP